MLVEDSSPGPVEQEWRYNKTQNRFWFAQNGGEDRVEVFLIGFRMHVLCASFVNIDRSRLKLGYVVELDELYS